MGSHAILSLRVRRGEAPMKKRILGIAAIVLSGCVATASTPPPRGVVVNGPPPPPIQEVRSAPPSEAAIWLDGYWHWTGAQYTWIPGHWENAPPGQSWYGPRYVNSDGSYFYEQGGWRPGANPAKAPQPRANAFR
jgi:hypothetical protein